jgi:polar amino acid transport system substrate-binding protein
VLSVKQVNGGMNQSLKMTVITASWLLASTIFVLSDDRGFQIPNFTGDSTPVRSNALTNARELRFLTRTDEPPFNFLDKRTVLNGFNVYLAKLICQELRISACSIQALPPQEMLSALKSGQVDGIIGFSVAKLQNDNSVTSTKPYLRLPARFIALKGKTVKKDIDKGLARNRVGVIAGSHYETTLRSFFPRAIVINGTTAEELNALLLNGEIEYVFGSALYLSAFINSKKARKCCAYVSGSYYSGLLTENDVRIFVLTSRNNLIDSLNKALSDIQKKHGIDELFLRFFPYNFYKE